MTTDKTLSNLKRRLAKAELEHLRNHTDDLAQRLEMMKERARHAEEQAEWYCGQHTSLIQSLTDQGESLGMAPTGEIGLMSSTITPASCAIGEQWPGTDATYAGISLSSDNTRAVHLILWPEGETNRLDHAAAQAFAESVNHPYGSHLPTRIQYITLHENLNSHFDKSEWYWTATKTASGKAAFIQGFGSGIQDYDALSAECRVRAVSEIPL